MARTIILQVLAFLAAMHLSSAMVPFKRPSMRMKEIPRGGAGPLDSTTIAKELGAAGLIQGTQFALAPEMNSLYGGVKVTNECNAKTTCRMGLSILNVGLGIYCYLYLLLSFQGIHHEGLYNNQCVTGVDGRCYLFPPQ